MISGTITNSDGSTNYFEARGNGVYYECLEFKQDGTLIRTYPSDGSVAVGVYTYNDATKSLSYKYNGDTYFMPGVVSVISSSEMNLTTDLGSVGLITQYFEKIR